VTNNALQSVTMEHIFEPTKGIQYQLICLLMNLYHRKFFIMVRPRTRSLRSFIRESSMAIVFSFTLSSDEETAHSVGQRHGLPVVLVVQARDMHRDGFRFFMSNNGVWLTEYVPRGYLNKRGG